MMRQRGWTWVVVVCLFCAANVRAQQSGAVPRLIKFSGVINPQISQITQNGTGQAGQSTAVGVTFSLYELQEGGSPLWSESQKVQVDEQGHYTVLLGATQPEGLPLELFTSGKALWLGVQPQLPGAVEQPRVLLVAVPYALKAADSDTLGGMPASAFLTLANQSISGTGSARSGGTSAAGSGNTATHTASTQAGAGPSKGCPGVATDGAATPGSLAKFVTPCQIEPSLVSEVGATVHVGGNLFGAGNVGVGADLILPQTLGPSAGVLTIGGSPFLHACCSGTQWNTFVGSKAGNFTTTGGGNTASGALALYSNTTGGGNTASGFLALYSNTTGGSNTASGFLALASNTTGNGNTANGISALQSNTTGFGNTASGISALQRNTTGFGNTASGNSALGFNTTGDNNTANGINALNNNTTGGGNTADGGWALSSNTTGSGNTADGGGALGSNTTGYDNTASGSSALGANTTGNSNTASGVNANGQNTTGSDDTATGAYALVNNATGSSNVAFGDHAGDNLVSGNSNIMLGSYAGTGFNSNESNNIVIGNNGVLGESNVIRIGGGQGNTYIVGIRGQTTGNNDAVAVLIDSNGQLGTVSSSRRYKEDIHDMGEASDGLLRLRPVTFRYKRPYADGSKPVQYGLIAEEVAGVYPDLVAFNKDGQAETVQYYKLDAMLLNEIQKLAREHAADHQRISELETQTEKLQSQVTEQRKQNEKQQAAFWQLLAQVRVIQAALNAKHAMRSRVRVAKGTAPAGPNAVRPYSPVAEQASR